MEFWKKLQAYSVFISELVIEELSAVTDKVLSRKLSNLVKEFHVLNLGEFEIRLAKEYVNAGAIPLRSLTDALHLAITSINGIDIFVSWNFKHIVNIKTRRMVSEINQTKGYKVPMIYLLWRSRLTKNIFDVKKAIKESGLSKKEVKHILTEAKKEFPADRLMYELHVIRALQRLSKREKILQ